MQLVPRYLVNNRIEIISNEAGFVTEYRPVYQRQLKVYRGIDNNIQFRLLNADQKPINSNLYTPRFVAFDEKNNCIIECSKKYFRPAEVDTLIGDATKAKKLLKWKPKHNIHSLIKDMISYELAVIKNDK